MLIIFWKKNKIDCSQKNYYVINVYIPNKLSIFIDVFLKIIKKFMNNGKKLIVKYI